MSDTPSQMKKEEQLVRVLLVEDEASLREPLAKRLRERYGFEVGVAANIVEAQRMIAMPVQPYDVALIDDLLPLSGTSTEPEALGIELMRQFQERFPGTPCIVFTGWGMDRALEALRAGAYRYLAKPFNQEELAMTIRAAAEQNRLRQQLEITKQEKEWLQTFLEIGTATTSVLELDQVLERVHEQVGRFMDASSMCVVLYDEISQTLRFELGYDRGHRKSKSERPLSPEHGLTDWVIVHSNSLLIKDLLRETLSVPPYGEEGEGCSWLGVPLSAQGRVIGALTLQGYEPDQYTNAHEQILAAVATQVANAVENARLFSELNEAKEWRDALIESAFDGVIAIDERRRLTVFNRSAEEMLGWKAEELIGGTVATLHTDIRKAMQIFDVAEQEGIITGLEVQLKHRDGSPIPALLSATAIRNHEGRSIGQAGFMRDLRQLHLLEGRLRALMEAGRVITSTLELDEVLNQVVSLAVAAVPMAQGGSIYLYDARTNVLYLRANTYHYCHAAVEACCLRPGEGIAGWVFQNCLPAVVDDARADPRHKWIDHPEVLVPQSMISVPLRAKERVIGAICLDSPSIPGAFQSAEMGLLSTFADQAAIAIENARLYQETRSREQLLAALDEASRHIRAERETSRLLHEIVRLAVELANGTAGCLFVHREYLSELELQVTYNLPSGLLGNRLSSAEGLAGQVARTGKSLVVHKYDTWADREAILEPFGFTAAMGVPLEQAGHVDAVLWIGYGADTPDLTVTTLEILERFAEQAAIALQSSRLIEREQRALAQFSILHQISDYVQAAGDLDKILHVVLTGVTASYALGFNRAALFLLDERGEYLTGIMGIGYLDEEEARRDWARAQSRGLHSFQQYLELLEGGFLSQTPVGERITRQRISATSKEFQMFMAEMCKRRCAVAAPEELAAIPIGLFGAFEPAFPLVIVPLMARGQAIGLLVADNKFTRAPITTEDQEALLTYVNTAAIAIQNAQLLQRERTLRQQAETLREISTVISSHLDLGVTTGIILDELQKVVDFEQASIQLIQGDDRQMIVARGFREDSADWLVRPVSRDRLVSQIVQSQRPLILSDSRTALDWEVLPETAEAMSWVGQPLVYGGNTIGFLTLSHSQPGFYTPDVEGLLSSFANHAAIAIQNAKLFEQLGWEKEQRIEAIREIGFGITAGLDVSKVLVDLLQKTLRLMRQASVGEIWLLTEGGGRLELKAIQGDLEVDSATLETGTGIPGWVAQVGKPYLAEDVEHDPHFTRRLAGTRSELAVPMFVGQRIIGVLNIEHPEPGAFVQEDVLLLEAIASQVTIALENARLFEQLTQAYTELQDLDRKKDEFLSMVSHELRSPLEPIQAMVEGVLAGAYGPIDEILRNRMERARAKIYEEARLVENMLDLARIQEGRSAMQWEQASVRDLIQEVAQVWEYDAREKKIDLRIDLPSNPLTAVVDRHKVKQILTNLLSNAFKFTPERGGGVHIIGTDIGDLIQVQVSDTGIGIGQEEQDKVFGRFYQVDSSLTRRIGGTGIGLSIVKEYVEMHGGSVELQSELGKGSTFTFTLAKRGAEHDKGADSSR